MTVEDAELRLFWASKARTCFRYDICVAVCEKAIAEIEAAADPALGWWLEKIIELRDGSQESCVIFQEIQDYLNEI